MPGERPRIYWDANVFLSYLDGDEDRLPTIEELLRQSSARNIELVTSAMSQVELAFAPTEKEAETLDPSVEDAIEELWAPSSPITLVELYPAVATEARALMRRELADGRSGLKPADAIHLATAVRMRVSDFHTYDSRLQVHAPAVPFPVREPFTPQGQLPRT